MEIFLDKVSCELKSHQSLHNSLRISLILNDEIYTYLIGIFSSHFAFHIHLIYEMKVYIDSKVSKLKNLYFLGYNIIFIPIDQLPF